MNNVKGNVPNLVTCLNTISGCIAVAMAFSGQYMWASVAICAAAVFDFLDGAVARVLDAYSPMGKELDSLSDLISFGVAPAAMVYTILPAHISWVAILIPLCGAIRLARFNVDTRQTESFIGLPIPANALFWIGAVAFWEKYPPSDDWTWALVVAFIAMAMLAPIRMPSLKFHDFKPTGENRVRYLVIILTIGLVATLGVPGLAAAIACYILLGAIGTLRGGANPC